MKLQVEWNPLAVTAYRLVGYENRDVADRDFRNDAVDAGEIGAGHQVTALYEVLLAEAPEGQLATVRVRNKAPGADAPAVERSYPVSQAAIRPSFSETDRSYQMAVVSGTFAEVLRGSPHAEHVDLRELQRMAQRAGSKEYVEDAELAELIGRAAELKGGIRVSAR